MSFTTVEYLKLCKNLRGIMLVPFKDAEVKQSKFYKKYKLSRLNYALHHKSLDKFKVALLLLCTILTVVYTSKLWFYMTIFNLVWVLLDLYSVFRCKELCECYVNLVHIVDDYDSYISTVSNLGMGEDFTREVADKLLSERHDKYMKARTLLLDKVGLKKGEL